MTKPGVFSSIQKPLAAAQEVSLFLKPEPTFDETAAALGLMLSLQKAGKNVIVYSSQPMKVSHSQLVGIDKIKQEIQGKNLVVSFDYLEDSIEKVSYNIENDKFNLVVQPKAGFPPLDKEKVAYTYTGAETDLTFIFGLEGLDDLGNLYRRNKALFSQDKLVSVSPDTKAPKLAEMELIFAASCHAEIIARMVAFLGLPVDADIATNLYLGLVKATRQFADSRVTAGAFEAAAFCLRSGAQFSSRPDKTGGAPLLEKPANQPAAAEEPPPPAEAPEAWTGPKIYNGSTRV